MSDDHSPCAPSPLPTAHPQTNIRDVVIPVTVLITLFTAVASGTYWAGRLSAEVESHVKVSAHSDVDARIATLKTDISVIKVEMRSMHQDVEANSRKLDRLLENGDN